MPELHDPALLILGACLLLLGWVLYRAALAVVGGVLVGAAGLLAGEVLGSHAGATAEALMPWRIGGGLLGAVMGCVLLLVLHKAVFFGAGFAGALAVFLAVFRHGREAGLAWAESEALFAFGAPAAALLGGLLAMAIDRYAITAASALVGAVMVMEGLAWPWDGWPLAALVPLGIVVQLGIARPWRRPAKKDRD